MGNLTFHAAKELPGLRGLSRCPHLHKMIVPSKILTAMKRFDLDMAIRLEIFKVKKTSEAVGGHCVVGGSSIILASQHNR